MLRLSYGFTVLLCGVLLAGCSGSGAASGDRGSSSYRDNFGSFSRPDIVREAEDALLTRYGFRFQRRVDTSEDVRLETEWKDVNATADEQAQGYAFARVRVTVTARPRNRAAGTYTTYFEAETLVQQLGDARWEEVPMTPEREEYIREIADYIKTRLRTGMRS